MMTLGERLRQLRGDNPQKAIAQVTGLSVSYLSDMERDRTEPPLRTLAKLARAFNTNVPALLAPVDLDGVEDNAINPLPFDALQI
jgi:transcriptional regulator with XRE-family HTH domain